MMRKRLGLAATCALLAFTAWAGPLAPPARALGQADLLEAAPPGPAAPALAGPALSEPSEAALTAALPAALSDQPRIVALSGSPSGLRGADAKELDGTLGDNVLGSGLLGALFFGVPYQGLNSTDFIVMFLIGLLIYRRLNIRPKKDGRRFTLHSRDEPERRRTPPGVRPPAQAGQDGGEERQGRTGAEGREDPRAGTPGATYASGASGASGAPYASGAPDTSGAGGGRDPRDNPWSRRLGTSLQSPPDSPWLRGRGRTGAQDRHSGPFYGQGGHAQGPAARTPGAAPSGGPVFAGRAADIPVPEDFDAADFLEGARTLYVRLQEAWAGRDMSGLQDFMTPDMLALLQKGADRQPLPLSLNIMSVGASLLEVTRSEGREEARVLFEALMAAGREEPAEVREEWLFVRGLASHGMWQLAGIKGA